MGGTEKLFQTIVKPIPKKLRTEAEKLLATTRREVAQMPADDVRKLVHELQVHQIELEMQNDELHRAQLELEAARERLLVPYDAAPVGFLTLDAKGVICEANLAAARLLNFDRIKLPGQKLTHFIAPESQDIFYLCRRQLLSAEEKQTCELHLLRTGGPPFIARMECVVEQIGPEPSARSLVMMSDITGQKRADEALRKSEARLATFAEATFEGIVESEAGRIIDCNEQYARMMGSTVTELKGTEIAAMIAPDYRERVMVNIREGKESAVEHVMFRKDGTRIMVEAHGRPIPGTARRHSAVRDITARKQAEEEITRLSRELQQKLDVLETVFQTVPIALGYAEDPQCRHIQANPAMQQVLGVPQGGEVSKSAPPGQAPTSYRIFQNGREMDHKQLPMQVAACEGQVCTGTLFQVLRTDGRTIQLHCNAAPLLDEQGKPRGAVGAFLDVTYLKRAEEALRLARDELEMRVHERTAELTWANTALRGEKAFSDSLIELAPAVIAVIDAQGNLIRTNAYTEQLTAYPFAETQGRNMIQQFVPKGEQPRVRHLLGEALAGRAVQQVVAPLRTRDGSVRQIEWFTKPLANADGEISALLAIGQDITARKQVEAALIRSEHHLSNFFNQAPIGLVWLSASGTVLRANQTQLDLLGCSAEEYMGHSFLEFCTEASHGHELLEQLAKKETVRNLRMTRKRKDGAIVHVLVDANSFWSENEFQHSSVFLRDITDRLKLEREVLHVSEREHRRIAQDLHDGLGQLLVGTVYLINTLQKDLAAKSVPEARRLTRIMEVINEAIWQTRNLARGLHPVEPEPNGLMAALETLAVRTKKMFRVPCHFTCRRPVLVTDNAVVTHLFRIAQEAVTNAIKHASPGNI